MNERVITAENLKKIDIGIKILREPNDRPDLTRYDAVVSFIFGIGSGGLTPFEFELANKKEGDHFVYNRGDLDPETAFGHLAIWFLPHLKILNSKSLFVRVLRITDPDQNELLKALAEVAQCGDHCCNC